MVDFAPGVVGKNYGINNRVESRAFREAVNILFPLVMIASILSFHIWVRSRNIEIGYETEQLKEQADRLARTQQQIVLEEQTALNPEALESIARNELGMTVLRANQVIPPSLDWNWSRTGNPEMGSLIQPALPEARPALN